MRPLCHNLGPTNSARVVKLVDAGGLQNPPPQGVPVRFRPGNIDKAGSFHKLPAFSFSP